MRYRVMRNGTGQYYIQYRRFLVWWDYQLPVDTDTEATVTLPTEAKAVELVHRLMLEREKPVLVGEYRSPDLVKLHLDDLAKTKKRVAAAEAAIKRIFSMYSPTEGDCDIVRAIRAYYDKYPHPMKDEKDD